jgi:hypothetical protein
MNPITKIHASKVCSESGATFAFNLDTKLASHSGGLTLRERNYNHHFTECAPSGCRLNTDNNKDSQ